MTETEIAHEYRYYIAPDASIWRYSRPLGGEDWCRWRWSGAYWTLQEEDLSNASLPQKTVSLPTALNVARGAAADNVLRTRIALVRAETYRESLTLANLLQ